MHWTQRPENKERLKKMLSKNAKRKKKINKIIIDAKKNIPAVNRIKSKKQQSIDVLRHIVDKLIDKL